jgi:hypothetical protein
MSEIKNGSLKPKYAEMKAGGFGLPTPQELLHNIQKSLADFKKHLTCPANGSAVMASPQVIKRIERECGKE